MGATLHLGLDLGVTNVKWAVVERTDDWRIADQGQAPTLAAGGREAVIGRLVELGRSAIGAWPGISSAGIGVPGLYDPAAGTTIFLVNVPDPPAWRNQPLARPVSELLGIPVCLINDARAFGLAELRVGAARGARSMVGLTLGTGIGGVIAVDGRVHQGHDGTAGEVGHQTINPDGPWCGCGNRGCLEAYARADQIAAACGTASPEEAVTAARGGDERAVRGLADIGRYLGIGIANVVTLIAPDRVVLGGGVALAGDLLFDAIRAELRRRVHTTSLAAVELVTAQLGVAAGAVGAAIHAAEQAAGPRAA